MSQTTIADATLAQMEADAAKMKSELHVGNYVRALTAEVRRLSAPAVIHPTPEAATAALTFVTLVVGTLGDGKDGHQEQFDATAKKAFNVLDRFFS